MKTTIRIPGREQYSYIEVELDSPTYDNVMQVYNDYMTLMKPSVGLSAKDFNTVVDAYLVESHEMTSDEYLSMSPSQQEVIQTIKRSLKRIKAKYGDEEL